MSLSDLLSSGDIQQVIVTEGLHAVVMPGEIAGGKGELYPRSRRNLHLYLILCTGFRPEKLDTILIFKFYYCCKNVLSFLFLYGVVVWTHW